MVVMIGVVDILKWIPVMMIAMTVTFTVLTCVVPRETKYKSGVSVRKKVGSVEFGANSSVYTSWRGGSRNIRDTTGEEAAQDVVEAT
ncbi:hypothetical protein Y032_0005g2721 [Ancylostoma ceylanicum]|uniref:Uncharacterized protein n=1 Tax=Ancylostoma ceylanicum TaxID=53326 RepID=A0A016VU82_9BILA|nr:hypothetical protein Y032_0005g2721 [Ancylostoma ceylanicum]